MVWGNPAAWETKGDPGTLAARENEVTRETEGTVETLEADPTLETEGDPGTLAA